MSPKVFGNPIALAETRFREGLGVVCGGARGVRDRADPSLGSANAVKQLEDEGDAREPSDAASVPVIFERVYEEQFAFAWRSLRLLGVASDVLEDAAQDVFAVVSRQLCDFGGRSSLRTWIFAIVQRTAANYRRRHRRKNRPLVPLGDVVVGHEPTPQAHAEAAEAAGVIERFCEGLDSDRRALFVLALLEEVPAPEVARALDLPLNTVYSRVRSLRAGLALALGQSEEDHD